MKSALEGLANVYRSEPYFIEVVPRGIDKAVSIAKLIDTIGIDQSETMAFGDGFNDISMIKYVTHGIAMANGCDLIKQSADYITTSNDNDGVAKFLYENVL